MYSAVRNLEWVNAEHTQIKCEVNFDHVGFEEWTPFCADPTDMFAPYCKEIFDRASAGEFGEIKEFIPPVIYDESMYHKPSQIPVVDVTPSKTEQLQSEVDTLKAQVAALLAAQQPTGA